MKKHKNLWIGIVSVGLALLVFCVLLFVQKRMKEEPVYEPVLCAKESIDARVVITEENASKYIEMKKVPVSFIPEQSIKMLSDLYGEVFLTSVAKGSILTEGMSEKFNKDYEDYDCLTWISVPVKELYEGVAGTVRKGDYIDIYTLWKEDDKMYSQLLLEHVRVQETFSAQGASIQGNEDGLCQLIVVPIEKGQVATFYEMLAKGNVRIAKYEES